MSKCWKCGNSGMFLSVGKSGLCVNCLEEASETAIQILNMIKAGGDKRKKAMEMLDNQAAQEVAERASEALAKSKFSQWGVSVHADAAQLDRIRRSPSVKIISYDKENEVAEVKGSGKEPYKTTFSDCTCSDFAIRHLPCKHMYRMAALYGGIDFTKYLEE